MRLNAIVSAKKIQVIESTAGIWYNIPSILYVWKKQGWSEPTITQDINPNRVTLSLPLSPTVGDKSAIKIGGNGESAIKEAKKQLIIAFLTDRPEAKTSEIAEFISLKPSRVRDYLSELIADGIVIAVGANRNRTYRLKA